MKSSTSEMYNDGRFLKHNKSWAEEHSPYKAWLVQDCMERNNLRFESCADVGCGAGAVMEILAKRYPDKIFDGFDIADCLVEFWERREKRTNLNFYKEDLLKSDKKYDLAICLDVFEHVEDYFGFLRSLLTRAKGFIFKIPLDMNVTKVATGGVKSAREEVGHLHYFNQYTAIQTLEDCGYSIRDARLSFACLHCPPSNWKQLIGLPIRLSSMALGRSLSAAIFGGVPLVVYAVSDDD